MALQTRLVDARFEELLKEERRVLADLRSALARFEAGEESLATLDRSIEQLDELFLIVVVGEFNAGKSAFINALIGRRLLEEGVTPTTARVTLLRYGDREERRALASRMDAVAAPIDLLRDLHIVDTPGTNAIIREHETITSDFVPRSDLVLFVTSADRPFTETERAFLERIRDWGKKIVIVVNKADIFERPEDAAEVREFVAVNGRALLGLEPDVFLVSARAALRAKEGASALWTGSGFEALEGYVRERLDPVHRVRLKLLNPLGVGRHLTERYLAMVGERRALLKDDVATLEDVERQLDWYERDMARDFDLRMSEIENVLLEMERRGHEFFDEMLRVGRVFDLVNRSRVQQAFEQQVVGDAPRLIEQRVNDLVDWLVDADFRQWQAVTSHLAARRREHRDRIVGDEEARFLTDRSRLIDSVGRAAQQVVDTYDRTREARQLADAARNAVAATAAAGAGAVGLGALVTAVATTAAADVTGLVMAGALAAIGFFILPARRRRAKNEMRDKISAMRAQLATALRTQFAREIDRSARRIREGIAPYSRFVRAEAEKLGEMSDAFERARDGLDRLRAGIEAHEPASR
jgi:small GTP-binding protein